MTQNITIHTDGSCHGNPGPGGWAAIIEIPDWMERNPTGRRPADHQQPHGTDRGHRGTEEAGADYRSIGRAGGPALRLQVPLRRLQPGLDRELAPATTGGRPRRNRSRTGTSGRSWKR